MKNLILMTFITMGLMFTSCSDFNSLDQKRSELSENQVVLNEAPDTIEMNDYFECRMDYFNGDTGTILYTETKTVCTPRLLEQECYYGNACTYSDIILPFKILRDGEPINYNVHFTYDHLSFTRLAANNEVEITKSFLYVCDKTSVEEVLDGARFETFSEECLTPDLAMLQVPLVDKLIPGVQSNLFISKTLLKNQDRLEVSCQWTKVTINSDCEGS